MNLKYYSHIYLNPFPSALDMSLLDTEEYLYTPEQFNEQVLFEQKKETAISLPADSTLVIWHASTEDIFTGEDQDLLVKSQRRDSS